jgi:hypothetical protein
LVYLGEQEDEEGKEEGKGLYRPTRRKKQRPGPAISKPAGQRKTSVYTAKRARSRSSHQFLFKREKCLLKIRDSSLKIDD